MALKKIIEEYFPNIYKLGLICSNILILATVIIILFFSYGGFYYKQSFMPGQKEMLPAIIFLSLLVFARHFIKLKNEPGIKTDKLTRLLNDKKWIVLILLLVLVFGYYTMYRNCWNMSKDSNLYYVYLRSLFFDGDLHFTNDYMRMGGPVYSMNHQTGYWLNPFAVGCSILWSPLFLTGHLYAKCFGFPADGYSEFPYGISINLAGLLLAWIGLVLLVTTLQKFFEDKIAILTALIVWFGTPLTFYTNQQPNLDTSLSFFAGSSFLYFFFLIREKATTQRWIGLGISAGIAMLIRPQNIILLIIPAILLLRLLLVAIKDNSAKSLSQTVKGASLLLIFTTVTFIPQMLIWQIMYNSALTIPQGKNWMEWNNPKILQVLFSTNHGLFTWTPILLLGSLGLFLFFLKDKWSAPAMLLAFLMMIYINSVPNDWWGGSAFGGRRFSSTFPILAFGIASLIKPAFSRKIFRYFAIGISLIAILWNISLISIFSDKTIRHHGVIETSQFFSLTAKRAVRILTDLPGDLGASVFVLTHKNACADSRKIVLEDGITSINAGEESPFFRNGWSMVKTDNESGKSYRTSTRNISSLHFYLSHLPENGLKAQLFCRPIGNTRLLSPVINYMPIKNPIVLNNDWNKYEFKIEGRYLQKGVNILRFDSFDRSVEKPKIILQGASGEYFDLFWLKLIENE
jgi:hypothetical protein